LLTPNTHYQAHDIHYQHPLTHLLPTFNPPSPSTLSPVQIRGAVKTLENYKAFRSQTELIMERRSTAISQQFNSPLILAQQEIDLLKKKVERRDEMIRGLRLTMSTSATLVRQGDHPEINLGSFLYTL